VLAALLARLQQGDSLVVYKVDRIAIGIRDLAGILDHCADHGAPFRDLTKPFDTSMAAGRMMVPLLGIVAEFTWHMIRDRSMRDSGPQSPEA
jgi:DNA invertase Pin-like site-specific DNA recombinase